MPNFDDIFKRTKKHTKITKKSFKDYWERLQLTKLKNKMLVEELIDNVITYDDCENTIKIVQNSYNILQVKEKLRIPVTGIMDESTIKALNDYGNPLELFIWINMNQFNYYKEHNVSDQSMKDWINDKVISNVKSFFENKE